MSDEGVIVILNQFTTVTRMASSGVIDMLHLNSLTGHLLTLDRMLEDFYDPPYREKRAAIQADAAIIYKIPDTGQYLQQLYSLCQRWIGAVSALLARKRWIADPGLIPTEDSVGEADYVADEESAPDMEG